MRFRVPIGQAAGQKKCTFSLWSYAQIRRDDPTSNVTGVGADLDTNSFDFRPSHDEPLRRDGYHFPTPPIMLYSTKSSVQYRNSLRLEEIMQVDVS